MNTLITEELAGNHDLRDQFWTMITEQDLTYKLPGNNPTLGELCEEMGMIQQIYTQSFKTYKMDWGYRGSKPDSHTSIASLKAWFKTLDDDLIAALDAIPEEDIRTKQIDRGHNFNPTLYVQFQVYREALLIFYAKASVYLKALEKQFTDQWKGWIG